MLKKDLCPFHQRWNRFIPANSHSYLYSVTCFREFSRRADVEFEDRLFANENYTIGNLLNSV